MMNHDPDDTATPRCQMTSRPRQEGHLVRCLTCGVIVAQRSFRVATTMARHRDTVQPKVSVWRPGLVEVLGLCNVQGER